MSNSTKSNIQKLVPIHNFKEGTPFFKCVSARQLYQFLEPKSRFNDWISGRINKYGFIENQDYVTFTKNLVNGGRLIEYALTLDMAKELAMVENNDRGRQARRYFIECEKELRQSAHKALPRNYVEALRQLADTVEHNTRLVEKVKEDAPKVDYCEKVLASTTLITATTIAKELGMSALRLNRLLCQKGIQYRQDGHYVLYAKYDGKGYTQNTTTTFVKSNGETATNRLMKWTEKGRYFIHQLLNSKLIQDIKAA